MQDRINAQTEEIIHHATIGNKHSNTMLQNAQDMKNSAQATHENSRKTFAQTKEAVENAITSLQGLSNINEMTQQILDIASQTNLLSLTSLSRPQGPKKPNADSPSSSARSENSPKPLPQPAPISSASTATQMPASTP